MVQFSGPGSIQLSTAATEAVLTYLSIPPDGSQSDPRSLSFSAGTPAFLSSAVGGDMVTLYLPPTAMRVCGAKPVSLTG